MTKVRNYLQWLVLTGALITLLFVIAKHGDGSDGSIGALSAGAFSSLVYKIVLLVVIGGMALTLLRGERFSRALAAALVWVVLALVLVVAYSYRFELHGVAQRVMAQLAPGHAFTRGRTVEITRAMSGDFAVSAQINGARAAMVLDTGATSIVLTREDAKAAGLPLEVLAYTVPIETANGRAHAAPVTLDHIAVGGLTEHSVEALIAQPGQLKTSLLGMSFLNRLQSWEVRGDRLLLRGYP
jgi:aspartyl protease family protein